MRIELEEKILHRVIQPTLKSFKDNDVCDHYNCPFDGIADHDYLYESEGIKLENEKVWEKTERVYRVEGKRLPFMKKLIGRIYVPIFRMFDIRGYRKREKLINKT